MSGKEEVDFINQSRRELMIGAGAVAAASMALPLFSSSGAASAATTKHPLYPSVGDSGRGQQDRDEGWCRDFLQGLGKGSADCLQSW